jgi:hypothetical protein
MSNSPQDGAERSDLALPAPFGASDDAPMSETANL